MLLLCVQGCAHPFVHSVKLLLLVAHSGTACSAYAWRHVCLPGNWCSTRSVGHQGPSRSWKKMTWLLMTTSCV